MTPGITYRRRPMPEWHMDTPTIYRSCMFCAEPVPYCEPAMRRRDHEWAHTACVEKQEAK